MNVVGVGAGCSLTGPLPRLSVFFKCTGCGAVPPAVRREGLQLELAQNYHFRRISSRCSCISGSFHGLIYAAVGLLFPAACASTSTPLCFTSHAFPVGERLGCYSVQPNKLSYCSAFSTEM